MTLKLTEALGDWERVRAAVAEEECEAEGETGALLVARGDMEALPLSVRPGVPVSSTVGVLVKLLECEVEALPASPPAEGVAVLRTEGEGE